MRRALQLALVVAVVAGCGDDGDDPSSGGTPTQRSESPSLAPTPEATPPTATAPSAPPPPLDATGPESQPGGAGDEQPARTAVRVVLDGEGLTPTRVEVPPFLALRVTVRNDLHRTVTVALRGGHRALRIRGRSTRRLNAGGLRHGGAYTLDAGTAGRATIVARLP